MIPVKQQHDLTRRLLFAERFPATEGDIARYFGPPRFPGTTAIGYRRIHPELFQDTLDCPVEPYEQWLARSAAACVDAVLANTDDQPAARPNEGSTAMEIVRQVVAILDYKTPDGELLADAIPQQMYEDLFVRIITHVRNPGGAGNAPHL